MKCYVRVELVNGLMFLSEETEVPDDTDLDSVAEDMLQQLLSVQFFRVRNVIFPVRQLSTIEVCGE